MPAPQDTSLQEYTSAVLDSALLDVHTSLPGLVVSYDNARQTATVRPGVKRVLDGELEDLPPIPDVSVAWPSAGGFQLRLPLAPGDTVWLVFSESAWAQFRDSGKVSPPGDQTRHALSYPIALPFSRVPVAGSPGARLVAPLPFDVGEALPTGFVALALKVDAALLALKSAVASAAATEGLAGGLGGMSALATALGAWPGPSTACTKLRTE